METLVVTSPTSISNNFKLSDLFADFNCPDLDDFIFDDVKLSISDNKVAFSGKLRMDGILSVFKEYLGTEDSILLSAQIVTTSLNLKEPIKAQKAIFTCTVPFFKEVCQGVSLTKAFFELDLSKSGDTWQIRPQLSGDFDVDSLTDKSTGSLALDVQLSNKTLILNANAQQLKGVFGIENLSLEKVNVHGVLGDKIGFDLKAALIVGNTTFDFAGIISASAVGLVANASKFSLDVLTDLFNEISPAGLGAPDFDISFDNSQLSLANAVCTIDGKSIPLGLALTSQVKVHDYDFQTTANISTNGVVFDGELGDLNFGPVDLKKTDLDFQLYKKSLQKPAKFEIKGEASIEGLNLDCGVYFEKDITFTTVLYAIIDAKSFTFSQIFPSAQGTFINKLSFSKLGFIFASASCKTKNEGFDFDVQEGLQLMGILEEIPGLSDLTGEKHIGLELSAHFGSVTDISIDMPDTRLDLGHSVTCDPMKLQINLLPQPALMAIFGMDISIPNQDTPLHFDMSISLDELEAKGAVTMKNYWKDPFGIHGIKIGPALALQLGIIYEQFVSTGIPSEFGIAGGLVIADTTVDMAVSISENPSEEILSGELDNLTPTQLLNFAAQLANIKVQHIPDFFDIKTLKLYCAPAGGTIGTITYQPGFSFSGDIVIAGEEISIYTRISDTGIEGAGHIDKLDFGPLKISGEKGKDASFSLEISPEKQAATIDGCFSFLGLEEGLFASISDQGISFKFEQDFTSALKFEVMGNSSGKLTEPKTLDFALSGAMDNQITDYLKTTVESKINQALNQTESSIDAAEKKVDTARKAYEAVYNKAEDKLTKAQEAANAELKKLTAALNKAKSDGASSIKAAQQKVNAAKASYDKAMTDAQNAVNAAEKKYDDGIDSAKKSLDAAQRTYNNGIAQAQKSVNAAEKKYNDSIGSAKRAVESAKKKVKSLDHWYSKPAYYAAKLALEAAEKVLDGIQYGADYTAFEAAKQALNVAKTGANYTAFQAAKQALNAAKTGVNYTAFESAKATLSAVKNGADYTAWQGALKSLSAAKTASNLAISTASKALNSIGSTEAYIALEAAKTALKVVEAGSEAVAFNEAKAALEAAKLGSEGVLKLSAYIAQHSGDLIDIKSFTFSGSLKEIEKGDFFKADLKLNLLGKPYNFDLDFNVKNVSGFIDQLFTKAFDELKTIVS
ncbi:cell envelope integrity protein TolA [Echinicola salinicaeni]|uniref:cell envelope integrity protein TolA n=1 Tax=Echinicola salinicaeni TaxID=2762757 RepID=UPI0016484F5C|nr:hypothetical protein [Echinicola salinicaeni]